MYEKGKGVSQNLIEALKYFETGLSDDIDSDEFK
jgi:TPR repeat protein